ncbi:LPS export ABC transporter periplasmic protein LptC [bacterium]|nr:LPS export ABC transporter periplasmic protein LptC [bacterium]
MFILIFLLTGIYWIESCFSVADAEEYDQKILNLFVSETDGEDFKWELKAEEALMNNDGDPVLLKQIDLHYFIVSDGDFFMRGDQADVDLSANRVYMKGKIRAESHDGISLETETLLWDGTQRSISTQDRVSIKRPDLEIYGQGLEADLGLERIEIKADAKTVIY